MKRHSALILLLTVLFTTSFQSAARAFIQTNELETAAATYLCSIPVGHTFQYVSANGRTTFNCQGANGVTVEITLNTRAFWQMVGAIGQRQQRITVQGDNFSLLVERTQSGGYEFSRESLPATTV